MGMSFDICMMAVAVGGLALSAAYVAAEYRSWREQGAAQNRRDAALRELHAASFSEQRESLLPSVVKLQGFGEGEAANPDSVASGVSRAILRKIPSAFPLGERRKRARQRATSA
jgi:hypothetical protein